MELTKTLSVKTAFPMWARVGRLVILRQEKVLIQTPI